MDKKNDTELDKAFHKAVWVGDIRSVRKLYADGADPNRMSTVGLTPLHTAVAMNDLPMTRVLVEECNAAFGPDRLGRWPTVIAAQCRASGALSGYIFEREAAWVERFRHPGAGPR